MIGRLPDCYWFAGRRLPQPLSGGKLYQCRTCFLKFRNPVETEAAYRKLYDNATTSAWDDGANSITRCDWEQISKYLGKTSRPGSRVLDVGCYTGGLLQRLGSDYRRFGVEVNTAAATMATEYTVEPVWPSIKDIPADRKFDIVIATDVVEHVVNPLEFIEHLCARLADDGVLILTTGDADNRLWKRFRANWWYCFNPEHVAFLSRRWLDYVQRTSGIEVLKCDTFRYANLAPGTRVAHYFLMTWYGRSPTTFLSFARLFKRLRGRREVASVPGVAISDDHLFIVLGMATGS